MSSVASDIVRTLRLRNKHFSGVWQRMASNRQLNQNGPAGKRDARILDKVDESEGRAGTRRILCRLACLELDPCTVVEQIVDDLFIDLHNRELDAGLSRKQGALVGIILGEDVSKHQGGDARAVGSASHRECLA